jgi:hypothetical protein
LSSEKWSKRFAAPETLRSPPGTRLADGSEQYDVQD